MSTRIGQSSYSNFRKKVLDYYRTNGRHALPWRTTDDPYQILVSEIMLQQTQVDRVLPYYERFLKQFPTIESLAKSDLSTVLTLWSGLGYNRRAKMLRDCARVVIEKYQGKMPSDRQALESLPGIGPYTAGAIRAFAFNEPGVFIETNIRTVFLHHLKMFHPVHGRELHGTVTDAEILTIAAKVASGQDPREWHWALMDYGSFLKRSGLKLNQKSAHYVRQTKFEGSPRQIRGAILRELSTIAKTPQAILFDISNHEQLQINELQLVSALLSLERDGMIVKQKGKWRIA